jgi:hypothetical protein
MSAKSTPSGASTTRMAGAGSTTYAWSVIGRIPGTLRPIRVAILGTASRVIAIVSSGTRKRVVGRMQTAGKKEKVSMKTLMVVALVSGIAVFADSFKVYPGAKLSAKGDKTELYSTPDPFAKVAYFYRAIGKEQKMPDGEGKGGAKATFTFDGGETIVISHPPPTNNPDSDLTSIDVQKK